MIRTIFFGSTDESVIVLEKLFTSPHISVVAVVTQPPRPVGREQKIISTPVETWAKTHNIPVLSFPNDKKTPWLYEHEQTVIDALAPFEAQLLISASFGQKIPTETITSAHFGGLNVHPSFLPRWRGADPLPWAILSGDHQTGVTIVTLSENFDEGVIIAQKKIPILPTDTAALLYPKLFAVGADLLIQAVKDLALQGEVLQGSPQGKSPTPYARRLTKQDGFISWHDLKAAMGGNGASEVDRKFRAFDPWPGLWTLYTINHEEKRLKILKLHLYEGKLIIDQVQLEGKKPTSYNQFSAAYLTS